MSEWARNMKKGNVDRNEGCVQIGDVLLRPVKGVTTLSQPMCGELMLLKISK